jgi:hypothetical protein
MVSGSIVLAIAAGWVVFKNQQGDQNGSIQALAHEIQPNARSRSPLPALPPSNPDGASVQRQVMPATPAIIQPEEREKILQDLQTAAITYDASHLSEIDPYLLHSNPEIRKAAMDAMLTLGDPAAGPLLRTAAARVSSPHEAVALLHAADYVELPSAKLKLSKRVKTTAPRIKTEGQGNSSSGLGSKRGN